MDARAARGPGYPAPAVRPPSLAFLCALAAPLAAQDWPHWRGPRHDGSSSATGLPATLDRTQAVRWSAALPGPGAATPIVSGERVFVSSVDEEAGMLVALCFDRTSGELRWGEEAGSGYRPARSGEERGTPIGVDRRSNYASPSPVTDGERVVFFYGNGDLVAFDLDGKRLWSRNLQRDHGDFAFQWTFAASPTLWDGLLYLPVLQRDQPVDGVGRDDAASFLLAIDPESGADVFKRERPSDAALESRESYATPIPFAADGARALLVVGGDVLSAHDPRSGEDLWRWGSWNPGHREEWWRIVPSPVVGAGRVLVCAPKKQPIYALRLDGEPASGALGDDALAWKSAGKRDPLSSDVPTPAFHRGSFYVLGDGEGALSRVEPATGKALWTVALPGRSPWEASPTAADGRIWCLNHAGLVAALDAESGKLLTEVALGEEDTGPIRSSIAVAHGALFVRTETTLFCLGR